jgi:hypothetical protein
VIKGVAQTMNCRCFLSNTWRAILCIMACAVVLMVACRPPTDKERLRTEAMRRLRAQLDRELAIDARFQRLGPATTSDEVLRQFNKPQATVPCSNAQTCWYYNLSGQKYFVCFDQHRRVVCRGKEYIFR